MMKVNFRPDALRWPALLVIVLILAACQKNTAAPTPTTDPNLVLTAAAQTASVRLTQLVAQTPTLTPTPAEPTPDLASTAAFATVSAELSATAAAASPTPSPTSGPTVTSAPSSGGTDSAQFVDDVTVPDRTVFSPKATFVKTWRVKNAGTSTWTPQYALVYVEGAHMGGPERVNLTKNVLPGETIDISVNLIAPEQPGAYKGYWRLLNPSGLFFDDSVYVEIVVSAGTPTPTGAAGTSTQTTGTPTPPTPTPTGVPGTPTATPTVPPSGITISGFSVSAEPSNYSGTCPATVTITARFTASAAGTVMYQWEAGSNTPGFTFSLPSPVQSQVIAGENWVSLALDITNSVDGWVRLHVTAPVDATSNQASFVLSCTAPSFRP